MDFNGFREKILGQGFCEGVIEADADLAGLVDSLNRGDSGDSERLNITDFIDAGFCGAGAGLAIRQPLENGNLPALADRKWGNWGDSENVGKGAFSSWRCDRRIWKAGGPRRVAFSVSTGAITAGALYVRRDALASFRGVRNEIYCRCWVEFIVENNQPWAGGRRVIR